MPHQSYAVATDADFPVIGRLLHEAFAGPLPGAEEWARSHTATNLRVMRTAAGEAEACLVRIPMGQHFGGRSVPMVGIAGVAADTARRGHGVARRMMDACVQEIAGEGVALSTLYASTRPFYRQVGYEAAGARFEYDLPIEKLPKSRETLEIRRLSQAEHQTEMTRCYSAFAALHNGTLDRGDYCWNRVWKFREEPYMGFGAFGPAGLEGYVLLSQQRGPVFGKHDVALTDAAFATAAGGRAILSFLAGYATMGDRLKFHGGPAHPFHVLLPHQWGTVRLQEPWMLRITDLRSAIESRGYDPAVRARVAMHVTDELVPANAGHWTIEVEGGRARVSREAGSDPLDLTIGGLAPIYSGYLTPADAALCGLCRGSPAAIANAGSIFNGPMPWMTDGF